MAGLNCGHDIIAFVRSPEKVAIKNEALIVVKGDAYTDEGVADAVESADVVISVIGPAENSPNDLMTVAGENIVDPMYDVNVYRFATLVDSSVGEPKEEMSILVRIQRFLLELVASETLENQETHVAQVRITDFEWMIVRAPFLTEGEGTGTYRAGNISLEVERLSRSNPLPIPARLRGRRLLRPGTPAGRKSLIRTAVSHFRNSRNRPRIAPVNNYSNPYD